MIITNQEAAECCTEPQKKLHDYVTSSILKEAALEKQRFLRMLGYLSSDIHENSKAHGFYDPPQTDGERIALMHSELSEALEYVRHGNPKSDHIPEFTGLEEELADTVIRILDWSHWKGLRLGEAILAKHEFNKTREFKHGGKTI